MSGATNADERRDCCIGAAFIALDEETGRMLGLVRLKEELDEETAEFAILVRSRLKGHGLGWLLMQRVIDYAKGKGLRRVYGDVLAEKHGHAANVRRTRLSPGGFRIGHEARRDRPRKWRRPLSVKLVGPIRNPSRLANVPLCLIVRY